MNDTTKKLFDEVFDTYYVPYSTPDFPTVGVLADMMAGDPSCDTIELQQLIEGLHFCSRWKVWPTYVGNAQRGSYVFSRDHIRNPSAFSFLGFAVQLTSHKFGGGYSSRHEAIRLLGAIILALNYTHV